MPDIPAACQGLADELSALRAQVKALAAQAEVQTGAAAWQTFAELGELRAQEPPNSGSWMRARRPAPHL